MSNKKISEDMIRTTVYLTKEQYDFVMYNDELTFSGLLRKIIKVYMKGNQNILEGLF